MKTCSLSVLLFGLTSFMASAAIIIGVNNDDPADFVQPLRVPAGSIRAAAQQFTVLAAKPEKVVLASLCASASPNVVASRLLAMNGLFGLPVNTNPSDPTGWYVVESNGWQWSDILTSSTFALWRGKTAPLLTAPQSRERGNRMVIHAMGQYPVSAYECEISTTLTNISTTRFPVGRDGAGNELPFSANFVGIKFGANGVLESTRDPAGSWTQVGDDTVFSNGELPSVAQYDIWVRFGATAVITAGNVNSMSGVMDQFRISTPTFTARLFKSGQPVHTQTATAPQLHLTITRGPVDPNPYDILKLEGGQQGTAYHLEYAYYPDGPWTQFEDNIVSGQEAYALRVLDGNQFYRAIFVPVSPQ